MADVDTSNMSAEEIAQLQKQNCIFCKIAAKQIPAKILHEDPNLICILDINPASEGHILIYPKEHYMILPHIPPDLLKGLFKASRLMSQTLLKTLQCSGTSMFVANGVAAGQKAPHVLIHIFPRRGNDGLLRLPTYEMDPKQQQVLADKLEQYMTKSLGENKKQHKTTHKPHAVINVMNNVDTISGNTNVNNPNAEINNTNTEVNNTNTEVNNPDNALNRPIRKAREQERLAVKIPQESPKGFEPQRLVTQEEDEDNRARVVRRRPHAQKAKAEERSPPERANLDDIAKLFGG